MLQLPVDLARTLESARSAVLAHPTHQLLPALRQTVYTVLAQNDDPDGPQARGYLASLTARYVLPIWSEAKEDDHFVENTIRMAEAVWLRQKDVEVASSQLGKAWAQFERLAVTPFGDTPAFTAGFAATKALAENLDRVAFQKLTLTDAATDQDVDPWSGDTAQYAAMAFSGPVWSTEPDISRRQAFWEWWLGSAVQAAWRATQHM